MINSKSIRILIIGYGSIGKKHLAIIKALSFQPDIIILRHSRDCLNSGYAECFSLEDAIRWRPTHAIVCTPTSEHLKYVLLLSEAGVLVLVEKPLCDLAAFSRAEHTKLLPLSENIKVAYPYRFHQIWQDVFQARTHCFPHVWFIDRGYNLSRWQPNKAGLSGYAAYKAMGGGAHMTLCHELDLFVSLYGRPSSAMGQSYNTGTLKIDSDELSIYTLQWSCGVTASFRVDMLRQENTLKIIGLTSDSEYRFEWSSNIGINQPIANTHNNITSKMYSAESLELAYRNQLICFLLGYDSSLSDFQLCSLEDGILNLDILSTISPYL